MSFDFRSIDISNMSPEARNLIMQASLLNRMTFATEAAKSNIDKYKKMLDDKLLGPEEAQKHLNVFLVCFMVLDFLGNNEPILDEFLAYSIKKQLESDGDA